MKSTQECSLYFLHVFILVLLAVSFDQKRPDGSQCLSNQIFKICQKWSLSNGMFCENTRHVVQLVELAKVDEGGDVFEAESVVLQDVDGLLK